MENKSSSSRYYSKDRKSKNSARNTVMPMTVIARNVAAGKSPVFKYTQDVSRTQTDSISLVQGLVST